ncbi:hypothetical protein C8J56DRAFT_249278 [Mycena floridula]|nr:hypothetical protein C8J56DRAFT_249278 [Mycena floridula]
MTQPRHIGIFRKVWSALSTSSSRAQIVSMTNIGETKVFKGSCRRFFNSNLVIVAQSFDSRAFFSTLSMKFSHSSNSPSATGKSWRKPKGSSSDDESSASSKASARRGVSSMEGVGYGELKGDESVSNRVSVSEPHPETPSRSDSSGSGPEPSSEGGRDWIALDMRRFQIVVEAVSSGRMSRMIVRTGRPRATDGVQVILKPLSALIPHCANKEDS